MTITLQWWALPVALVVFGIIIALVDSILDGPGFMSGCLGMVACFVLWAVAAGIIVGHFL